MFALPDKQRPVPILTRDTAVGHLSTVTVAPITSTIGGAPSEVVLGIDDGLEDHCTVNPHHACTVFQERLPGDSPLGAAEPGVIESSSSSA